MAFWLLKTEPGAYSFSDLLREGGTVWTGVKNPVAQRHLRSMEPGDRAAVYHTGAEKAAVGVASVRRAAYPDPTARGEERVCVDLAPERALPSPVPLARLKAEPAFAGSPLLRQGRLSVVPLTEAQWKALLRLGAGD
jgi:predicted RNA-binding protein with PUA-like domain